MKHFLLACFIPMTLAAQNMQQLTEQLGKTVLYGDVALSPDGTHVAWVQSTAASTSKQTYVRETSGNAPTKLVKLPITSERTDFDLAWSPDSKTLAFFSSAGERDQRQLWTVKGDASDAKKITKLNGYAARPRWSHDGKQIAFLYIEGAGGGGPLMAAPATTGVIDTAIHNQRIAVLDIANEQVRQVSPPDLHIYDYDWSPDDKMFVATAAPGPGDNNWWIAQIYAVDTAKGNATSIYKPWFQVAVPRWSPDGKSIAFIEGLMSDEGFHGGDLFTMSVDGHDVTNRTSSRKASVNSFFWQTPDRILLLEYVGGGSAISELSLTNNSAQTIWKGPEGIHAFGNFPDFSLSSDGKLAAAELSSLQLATRSFCRSPRRMASTDGQQRWLASELGQSGKHRVDERRVQHSGLASAASENRFRQKISDGRAYPRRTVQRDDIRVAGFVWNVACDHRCAFHPRLLRAASQSARQLRPGGRFHPREREGFRRGRFARRSCWSRCRDKEISN